MYLQVMLVAIPALFTNGNPPLVIALQAAELASSLNTLHFLAFSPSRVWIFLLRVSLVWRNSLHCMHDLWRHIAQFPSKGASSEEGLLFVLP